MTLLLFYSVNDISFTIRILQVAHLLWHLPQFCFCYCDKIPRIKSSLREGRFILDDSFRVIEYIMKGKHNCRSVRPAVTLISSSSSGRGRASRVLPWSMMKCWNAQSCVSPQQLYVILQKPCHIQQTVFHWHMRPHLFSYILSASLSAVFPRPFKEWNRCPIWGWSFNSHLLSVIWPTISLFLY